MNALEVVLGESLESPGGRTTVKLEETPHMLVAGMTGSGKSVFINSLLVQLLEMPPFAVRLLLLDPKRVEMAPYAGCPQLLDEPLWEPTKMRHGLFWLKTEMTERFEFFARYGVRSIRAWNRGQSEPANEMPYIVCVIDEIANLILGDKEVEPILVEIASMGRAAGIHLIIATQSPRADVLTGLIRANVPTRIAFATATQMESRIILEEPGAEELPGHGAMLARIAGYRRVLKLQGELVTEEDVDVAVTRAKEAYGA